ncbi:iron complex transport system ATP-binding protein [Rhodococcus sp. 27YEA15]|uniref:ABC transporter ATP-binding protein n=1 Tax=Rhodococcus sp. 27YEA15 TaxID=3156259 RepID=UPI003C7B2DD1
MTLEARGAGWRAGGTVIVDDVHFTPAVGTTVGLLGPNGSGKSTLLKLLAGQHRPSAGLITLDGITLTDWKRRDLARRIATVDQHSDTEVDLTVGDILELGRTPHRGLWGGHTEADRGAVRAAVEHTALGELLDRFWHTLSGGERQRVQIARALAQQPQELLLDEPTNHLDINHQLELLALVRELPTTTVMALHDLNLAAMFCDSLVMLSGGKIVASGTPTDVLTVDLIAAVYDVDAEVRLDGPDGVPSVRYLPPRRRLSP